MTVIISSANYGGAGGGWDPTALGSAVVLWLRAFTTGTTNDSAFNSGTTPATNTQTIATWHDVSGNSRDLVAGIAAPTWVTSGINGKPAVKLVTGAAQSVISGDLGALLSTNASFFCVAQYGAPPTFARLVSMSGTSAGGDAGVDTYIPLIKNNTSTEIATFTGFAGAGVVSHKAIASGSGVRMGSIKNGNSFETYVDGVASGSPGSEALTMGTHVVICVGANISANSPGTTCWDGYVGELIVTNTALSPTDITNVDTYLKNKYGL